MSAITLSDERLLDQFEKALIKYGQADAMGDGRRLLEYKKAINTLAAELHSRGNKLPYVRTIE